MSIKQKLINLLDDTFLMRGGDDVRIGINGEIDSIYPSQINKPFSDFISSTYLKDDEGNICYPSYIKYKNIDSNKKYYIIVFKNYLIPEEFDFTRAELFIYEESLNSIYYEIPSSIENEVDYYSSWEPQE